MRKHIYSLFILVGIYLLIPGIAFSQNVAINTSGNSAYTGTILDLSNQNTSGDNGFLPPYVSLASATILTTPITGGSGAQLSGLIVYNTNTSTANGLSGAGLYYWNNTLATPSWVYVGGSSGPTGTGTSNYLARWISPSALSTGVAQDNGSAMGISSSSITPQSMLDVNGNVSIGSYAGNNAAPANGMIVSGQMGIGTSSPNTTAALDITSTTSGLLVPRLTAIQIGNIVNPATGLMVFNTSTNCFQYYASGWQSMACPCSAIPTAAISGASSVCPSTSSTYTITGTGVSFAWSSSNTNMAVISGASNGSTVVINTIAITGTYTLTCTATNPCGSTAAIDTITVTGGPTSVTASATPNPVCSGSSVSLNETDIGGTSWNWSGPNTFSSGSQNPAISSFTAANVGTYTVTTSNSCGSSTATVSVSLITLGTPATPINSTCSGVNTLLAGTASSYSIAPVAGATSYSWSSNNTNIAVSASSTNTVTITAGAVATTGTSTLTVTAMNGCNANTTNTVVITVVPTTQSGTAGSIVLYTIPCGVSAITVTIAGAAGGKDTYGAGSTGGNGASFTQTISSGFSPGDVLKLATGTVGVNYTEGAGGGGGSFVWDASNTSHPLVIAGGGGGGGYDAGDNGQPGSTTITPVAGASGCGTGGSGGNGGAAGTFTKYNGGGGCGWLSNGISGASSDPGVGGSDYTNGLTGGAGYSGNGNGGFGGGGGGGNGAGGGGGYNGGGGANDVGGGGGGSGYYNGTGFVSPSGSVSQNSTANGSITITW